MKKVLFYGDSNTYGYDPAGFMGGRYPEDSRWTNVLQQNLAGLWRVSADGMPGRALPGAKYEWDYLRSAVLREKPVDLVAVMLGTNDLISRLHPDAEKTAAKMDKMITFIEGVMADGAGTEDAAAAPRTGFSEEAGPALPGILLIAPPKIILTEVSGLEPYVAGDMSLADMYYNEGKKLAGLYRGIALSHNIFFADASDGELEFAFDGVHLSRTGHILFAAEMMDVLRQIWNGSGHSCEGCSALPHDGKGN